MTLNFQSLNFWAILAGIASNMIIGSLWYSPVLFGNVWLKLVGKKKEDISGKSANIAMSLAIIPAIVSTVLLAILLVIINVKTVADALVIGSIVSAGFVGMSALNLVLFEDRSLALAVLNTGYTFVSLNIAAIILTVWK